MQKILADSGPLVALFDAHDASHEKVREFLRHFKGQLVTTWLVLTEVSHLLDFSIQAQIDFLTWIERGGLSVENLEMADIADLKSLTKKYHDRPMDLANASLLWLAWKKGIRSIISLDSDFLVYRLPNRHIVKNVL